MKNINIKMKSISSGPDGVMHQNTVYPVSEAKAKVLVDGGFAEYETAMITKLKLEAPEDLKKIIEDETSKTNLRGWGTK